MVSVRIIDRVEILQGGEGPCSLVRKYSISSEGETEVTLDDLILASGGLEVVTPENVVTRVKSAGSVSHLYVKVLDCGGPNPTSIEVKSRFGLLQPMPKLCLEIHGSSPSGLRTSYEALVALPFVVDPRQWDLRVSVKTDGCPAEPSWHRTEDGQGVALDPIDLGQVGQLSFVIEVVSARPVPVLPELGRKYRGAFDGVTLLIVPHLLGDFPHFAEALLLAGVEPARTRIVGIPYSSRPDVAQSLREMGFANTHSPTAEEFPGEIEQAIRWVDGLRRADEAEQRPFRWLIIEDGGYVMPALHVGAGTNDGGERRALRTACIGGVEQTRNGIWAYRDNVPWWEREIPLLSVADARLKLELESKWIGEAVVHNLLSLAEKTGYQRKAGDEALVVGGGGATGRRVARALHDHGFTVKVHDTSAVSRRLAVADALTVSNSLTEGIHNARLIVGCTGLPGVIGREEIAALRDGAIIASASSKRREIDWEVLEQLERPQRVGPSLKYYVPDRSGRGREFFVLADGYPVNFYSRTSVDPANIALIMGCLLRAAVALALDSQSPPEERIYRLTVVSADRRAELRQQQAERPGRVVTEEERRRAIILLEPAMEEELAALWERG